MSRRRVVLHSPDRGQVYDGRKPDAIGVGGGITARIAMLAALAAEGHDVTAYVNAAERVTHAGVRYIPLDECRGIETDVFIAMSTGGFSFVPLRGVPVRAALRIVWVQGVPKPADLDVVSADYVYVASNFLRRVCTERWGVAAERIFVCYNGLNQAAFAAAESRAAARDEFGMAYIGPPEKGLAASLEVLRRVRAVDPRFHLDIFGGGRLWGRGDEAPAPEPGVIFHGMLGQAALVPRLFEYEYLLAPQSAEEGFGIGVQEARRAGMIALVSNVAAFTELFRDGHDGFLINESHDTAACHDRMAELILTLARDPERRARIRARALHTPWSWTTSARTFTAHWDYVLSGWPRTEAFLDLPDGRHDLATGEFVPAGY
jgi:glycosyltransferase involved in cell wall biosynthesis